MARLYPTKAEAVEIHRQLIEEFGGEDGFLDEGRLEAALFRPQTGYYDDLVEEAAALMESLANNSPFVDGNKRTSFAVTDVFLGLNGFYLAVEPEEASRFMIEAIAHQEFHFERIRDWIAGNIRKL